MAHSNIDDLTIDELRTLIREVVTQTLLDLFGDPDEGLELRDKIISRLQYSIEATKSGGETVPAQDVADRLGLEW